jgi:hypothetical protein
MTDLLRIIPLDDTHTPVKYVCYHPIAEKNLLNGERGDHAQRVDYAVEYNYDSVLHEICSVLGWQGGTIWQVIDEIKRLKNAAPEKQGSPANVVQQPQVKTAECSGS